MADPSAPIECLKDVWTKVIDNNTSGTIMLIRTTPEKYLFARRDTGGAIPVGVGADGATPIFLDNTVEEFAAKAGSDVYIYPIGADGEVSVDI